MTDSNIQPPSTIPGTEVTTSPGLIPETAPSYDPNTANVDTAVPSTTEVLSDTTYVENDGSTGNIAPPPYTAGQPDITEVPPTDYAAAVDHLVDTMPESHHPDMPTYTESEIAHQEMMRDPHYAVATHEHTLNKFADLLEQIVARLNDIEAKLNTHISDVTGPDPNDPIKDYPEVSMHQSR